jgi:DNA-binding response OmpR family regulator
MTLVGTRILTVEDDERIRTAVKMALEDEGWTVEEADNGEEALDAFNRHPTDVVLIDIMLPGIDGFEVCRSIRRTSDVPIVMVTARADTHDVVAGLEAGADDYLVKPYASAELIARIRALLRRGSLSGSKDVLRYSDLRLDPAARLAWRGERPLVLTKTEFDLLELLTWNAGIVLSRETLYERIWGYDFETSSRSLDVYIGYLRAKLEANGEARLVQTVRGVGFVVREQ